jgi:hypothetical protein
MLPIGAVFQVNPQLADGIFFHFFPAPDITFPFQHIGQPSLDFRNRDIHVGMFNRHGIANAGKHIGNWISHHGLVVSFSYQLALRTPGIIPLLAKLRKQILQIPNFR